MNKQTLLIFFFGLFMLFSGTVVHAEDYQVDAKAAMAVDAKTGKILFDQNGDEPVYIASTTKLLTMYIVYEQIAQHKLSLDEEVTISKDISDLSLDYALSNVPLYEGQTYTVESLIYAGFLESANAAVMALAEHIAGSEQGFVDLMRAKLAQWQITDGLIVNSTGLPNEYLGTMKYKGSKDTDENQLSVKDMMTISRHLVTDFPEVLKVTETATYPFYTTPSQLVTVTSTNLMLPGMVYAYPGVNGLKTGTTELAGACFIASTEINGQEVLTAVYDATNGLVLPSKRFTETAGLLDHIADTWAVQQVATKDQPLSFPLAVENGKAETVKVHSTKDLSVWVQKDQVDQVTLTPTWNADPAVAPITKNQRVGKASVTIKEDTLGYLGDAPTVVIESNQAVEKLNLFQQAWKRVSSLFS